MNADRDEQLANFLLNDLLRVAAEDEMDLVRRRVELGEEALEVNRAARTGGGDDELITGNPPRAGGG